MTKKSVNDTRKMLFCSLTTDLLSALCYDQSADSTVLAVPALFCLRQCIAQKFASQRGHNCVIKGVFCISPGETAAPASAGCPLLLGVEVSIIPFLFTLAAETRVLSSRVTPNGTSVTPGYGVVAKMVHSIYEDTW